MKRTLVGLAFLSLILLGSRAEAASLPSGDWNINGNGFTGVLKITGVDAQGKLSGTVYGQPLLGFWDSASDRIVFMRLIDSGQPATFQIFTGYLFRNPPSPQAGQNTTYTLTGSFQAFAGTGATAVRNVFGWFAQMTRVG